MLIDVCLGKSGGLRLLKQDLCKSCGVPAHLQRLFTEDSVVALGEEDEDVKTGMKPSTASLSDLGVSPGQELVLLASEEVVLGHSRAALAECAERASADWGLTRLLLPFTAPRSGHAVLLVGKFTALPKAPARLLARAVAGLPRKLQPDDRAADVGMASDITRVAQAVAAVEVDVASVEVGKVCEVRLAQPLPLEAGQYVELCVVEHTERSKPRYFHVAGDRFETGKPHYFHVAADKETKRTCYYYSMSHSARWEEPAAPAVATSKSGPPPLPVARTWRTHLLEMDRAFEASDIALSVVMAW